MFDRLRSHRAFPWLRAAFVAFHLLAIVVLSLPDPGIADARRWKTKNTARDIASWADTLRALGFATDAATLERSLIRVTQRYASTYRVVAAPFSAYERWTGASQGWTMFASPQRSPGLLQIDVSDAGSDTFRPLYEARSKEHAWRRAELDHNRFRKFVGRFARGAQRDAFSRMGRYLARRAFDDLPTVDRVKVSLLVFDSLPPERVRAGESPRGRREIEIVFSRAEVMR